MLRWLPLEAVKASYWHRVNLGDTDELVGGLIGSENVLWPRSVADTDTVRGRNVIVEHQNDD